VSAEASAAVCWSGWSIWREFTALETGSLETKPGSTAIVIAGKLFGYTEPGAEGLAYAAAPTVVMPRSVAATVCRSARMSAVRLAPNAASNRLCAWIHLFAAVRKRATPDSVSRSVLVRQIATVLLDGDDAFALQRQHVPSQGRTVHDHIRGKNVDRRRP
jgi:hypothetical protein